MTAGGRFWVGYLAILLAVASLGLQLWVRYERERDLEAAAEGPAGAPRMFNAATQFLGRHEAATRITSPDGQDCTLYINTKDRHATLAC